MANKERLGTIGIFLTALIWGYSFVAVKVVVKEIEPFYLVGIRNLAGGIFLSLVFFKRMNMLTRIKMSPKIYSKDFFPFNFNTSFFIFNFI